MACCFSENEQMGLIMSESYVARLLKFSILCVALLCFPALAAAEDGAEPRVTNAANAFDDNAISGNPAFTEFSPGSGALFRPAGLTDEWGIRLGGIVLSDINNVFSGGAKPGSLAANNLVIVGLGVDGEKKLGWKGGSFGVNFLQINGQNTNGYAGALPGYNSIVAVPPFHRTELYEYWIAQEVIPDTLKIRVGKIIPAVDFNNVTRANKLADRSQNVSSLSSLLYTSIFVNPTLLGVIGGYYDSVFGTTANIALNRNSWLNLGVYDGNRARGVPTGIHNPHFNEYVFAISEIGTDWVAGPQKHPGQFGIGAWYQSGRLNAAGLYNDQQQTGAMGLYLYGGQRVWADVPAAADGQDSQTQKSKSLTIFYQFGVNNAKTLPVNQFFGVGATAFSIFDSRPDDSFGAGFGLSFLNRNLFQRSSELMFQTYYQASIVPGALYLQPTVTFIPNPGLPSNYPGNDALPPGMQPFLPAAFVGTLRLSAIF